MFRTLMLSTLLVATLLLAWLFQAGKLQAQAGTRSVQDLIADLDKGEKEKLKALQDLEALGVKAADAAVAVVGTLATKNEDVRLQAAMTAGKIGAAAVKPLSKALESKDVDQRFYAVWGLAFVGPPAKSAAKLVIAALKDESPGVRRKAAYALGRIDPDPGEVVGTLVGILADDNVDVRQAAGAALARLGKPAVADLILAIDTKNVAARHRAIQTLGQIGGDARAAIPELKQLLRDDNATAQIAAQALSAIGAPALPALQTAAGDDDEKVRAVALRGLQLMGATAVPALVDLLGNTHVDVRRSAALMLGTIPVNDKMVAIGLGFATRDKDFQVRRNALSSIQNLGPAAKQAEPYVSALLTDIDPQVRQQAFYTLRNLGVDPAPGLKKALANPDARVRINTASLMTALGMELALAEPILVEGLKAKDEALKMQAAHALSSRGLQADVVLPIFVAGLKNEIASVRLQAAQNISRYGVKASQATPALIDALDDADGSVRTQALSTLRAVGADGKTLLPAMLKVLRGKHTNLHDQAAQIVYQVGPDSVGEVIGLLRKEEAPALRQTFLQMLAMVGPPAKDAVEELVKALEDKSPRARMVAARALGNIGPDAKAALDALARAEKDDDGNVRAIAAAAREQIRADADRKEFKVQGVLTAGDPFDRVRTQHYQVVHTYRMKKGQTYTIDLQSPWDNYLRLEDARGRQLRQDDDSGGRLNARIVFPCQEDGWYRIIVTSYAARATGNYTLTVR
ncbi:MAG: HEAT repeat domain-containing protein [Planctomycetes bacterium]|nr:HEAT repeat domain-containing protein [Planctomycetota bacterium]